MDIHDKYAVDQNGRLVMTTTRGGKTNNYIVWGIGQNGLMHGVGAFLNRETYKSQGIEFSVINEPTFQEIEDYYKSLDRLWGGMKE